MYTGSRDHGATVKTKCSSNIKIFFIWLLLSKSRGFAKYLGIIVSHYLISRIMVGIILPIKEQQSLVCPEIPHSRTLVLCFTERLLLASKFSFLTSTGRIKILADTKKHEFCSFLLYLQALYIPY